MSMGSREDQSKTVAIGLILSTGRWAQMTLHSVQCYALDTSLKRFNAVGLGMLLGKI